jgi:HEAT repeat protein
MRRFAILLTAILLVGCSSTPPSPTSSGGSPSAPSTGQVPTPTPTPTPTATVAPTPTPTVAPTLAPLADRLNDPDETVRLTAARDLIGLSDPASVALMIQASADPYRLVAVAAITALGSAGGSESTKALLALTTTIPKQSDIDTVVKFEAAVKALAQIRGPAAITRLLEIAIAATSVGDIDLFADNGLAALGPDDVAALGSALGHANMAVRVKAIECLAAIGGDVAINLIIKQVASSNATVQAAAISALGDAGSTLATAALIKALDNSKNFDAATTSLAQIYDTDATPLLKYLKAKSTIKVYAPIIEIGQAGTESALITGLNSYGYKDMAVDYLNCGNPQLDKAAHTWATKHGYTVYTTPGGGGAVSWGG